MEMVAQEHWNSLLVDIRNRLSAVERRLEETAFLPRALRYRDAGRMLSCSERKVRQLVAEKKLRTVLVGSRRMVPLSEVVRITSFASERPKRAMDATLIRARPGAASAAQEAERARALTRRR